MTPKYKNIYKESELIGDQELDESVSEMNKVISNYNINGAEFRTDFFKPSHYDGVKYRTCALLIYIEDKTQ